MDAARVEVRGNPHATDKAPGHGLKPHRLPDTAGAGVEDAFRFRLPVLLAARDEAVRRGVGGSHHQSVVPAFEKMGNLKMERNVSALMVSGLFTVDPNLGAVVHRTKMEKNPFPPPATRRPKAAPVPHDIVKVRLPDAAQFALKSERHDDSLRKPPLTAIPALAEAGIGVVPLELPLAVQIQPVCAHELGTGIFRPGYISGLGGRTNREQRSHQEI